MSSKEIAEQIRNDLPPGGLFAGQKWRISSAKQFLVEVDWATDYWNASTRFTDGGEFGMGAEIGISTDKIGARGPMGLEELTSYKWIGIGNGQTRT